MQQRGKGTRELQNSAPKRDRYLIEAVDRALNLLELLGDNPGLGVTEIADRHELAGLARAGSLQAGPARR